MNESLNNVFLNKKYEKKKSNIIKISYKFIYF